MKKISSAYHGGLQKVLGLHMNTVEKHRIRNEHVRRNKLGVPHIFDIITKRHDFLGKIAKPTETIPRSMDSKTKTTQSPRVQYASCPYRGTLKHTWRQSVITTPHANLAEWIKLTADWGA
jgi:hypothetical protein